MTRTEQFIDDVCGQLNLPAEDLQLIAEELCTHVEQEIQQLVQEGAADPEQRALENLGSIEILVSQYRDAYLRQHTRRTISKWIALGLWMWLASMSVRYVAWTEGASLSMALGFCVLISTALICATFGHRALLAVFLAPLTQRLRNSVAMPTYARQLLTWFAYYALVIGFLGGMIGGISAAIQASTGASTLVAVQFAVWSVIFGSFQAILLTCYAHTFGSWPQRSAIRIQRSRIEFLLCWAIVITVVWSCPMMVLGGLNAPDVWFAMSDANSLCLVLFSMYLLEVASFGVGRTHSLFGLFMKLGSISDSTRSKVLISGTYALVSGWALTFVGGATMLSFIAEEPFSLFLYDALAACASTCLFGTVLALFCWALAGPRSEAHLAIDLERAPLASSV